MKNLRKLLSVFLVLIIITGCSSTEETPFANKDGSIIKYKLSDAPDGYYVMKNEDELYPLLEKGISKSPVLYQWFTKFDQLIPELSISEGDKLIAISNSTLPKEFRFTKMTDFGYTLPIRFDVKKERNKNEYGETEVGEKLYFSKTVNPFTQNREAIVQMSKKAGVITEINSQPFTSDLISQEGFVKGLEKDQAYKIFYYIGTKYNNVTLVANSRTYIEDYTLSTRNAEPKKDIYFEIELPDGMEEGVHIFNEMGSLKIID